MKKKSGFTLIELLTVISISSFLLGYISLPLYYQWYLKIQLKNSADQLFEALQLARNFALTRQTTMIVRPNHEGQWITGWVIVEKSSVGTDSVLKRYPYLHASQQLFWQGARGNTHSVQFDKQGMSLGYNGSFTFSYQKPYMRKTKWTITLSSTGRATLSHFS